MKHYLWHGNTAAAQECLSDLDMDLENWDYDEAGEQDPRSESAGAARMLNHVHDLEIDQE